MLPSGRTTRLWYSWEGQGLDGHCWHCLQNKVTNVPAYKLAKADPLTTYHNYICTGDLCICDHAFDCAPVSSWKFMQVLIFMYHLLRQPSAFFTWRSLWRCSNRSLTIAFKWGCIVRFKDIMCLPGLSKSNQIDPTKRKFPALKKLQNDVLCPGLTKKHKQVKALIFVNGTYSWTQYA